MKQISNWFIPPFLRRLDAYLLRNYPVIWRTKTVFVLFYGIVAAVVLFTAGFVYPVDAQHLTVHPITPIEMGYDNYHLWSVLFVSFGIAYWAYKQYELGFPFTKITDTLLTLFLYSICFFVLFGITTPAFRMGTIVKTAHYWMSQEDFESFEKSGIYPYGFVLLNEDEDEYGNEDRNQNQNRIQYNQVYTPPADTFFQRREVIFKSICEWENTVLQSRYIGDTTVGIHSLGRMPMNQAFEHYLRASFEEDLSQLSYLSFQSDWSQLSYLSFDSYIHVESNQFLYPYRSLLNPEYSRNKGYNEPHNSYVMYRSPNADDYSSRVGSRSIKYFSTYRKQKNIELLHNGYNFFENKEKEYDNDAYDRVNYCPTLPYSVENAVRSVKHARQFLSEKIYYHHWHILLPYILALSLLIFYWTSHILMKHLPQLLLLTFIISVLIPFIPKPYILITLGNAHQTSTFAYVLLPVICIFALCESAIRKQRLENISFTVTGIFVGLLLVLIGALFIIVRAKLEFYSISEYRPPLNEAFYGIQLLGLLGALLTTYVRSLPKTE